MNNTYDKIYDRISNRHWDAMRVKMRFKVPTRDLRNRVWGIVSTRVWARICNVTVRPGRSYRRFP